jgi:hypothetical protein
MDEAGTRFALYAEGSVLASGGEHEPFGGLGAFNLGWMATLNMSPYQAFGGLGSATTTPACTTSANRARNLNILGGGLVGSPAE